jgi:hypothetical protein
MRGVNNLFYCGATKIIDEQNGRNAATANGLVKKP